MKRRWFRKENYPENWESIRREHLRKARNRCECKGICGEPHGNRKTSRCQRKVGQELPTKKGGTYKVSLQLAHRCSCKPKCGLNEHLILLCNGCHLRMDMDKHQGRTKRLRAQKKQQAQQELFI